MHAMYAGAWPTRIQDPTEERDRYHRIAIHEARIASERSSAANPRALGLLARFRQAVGISPAQPDCVACA